SDSTWSDFLIYNEGSEVLLVKDVLFAKGDSTFQIDTSYNFPMSVFPLEYQQLDVTFKPLEKKTFYDSLIVQSNDPDEHFLYVKLIGTSINNPPSEFSLIGPLNDMIIDSAGFNFKWEESYDIDEDNIVYGLHLFNSTFDTLISSISENRYYFNVADYGIHDNMHLGWNVNAYDGEDTTWSTDTWEFMIVTDVDDELLIPKDFVLKQNYPNPFNPSTKIRFGLPEQSSVELSVYNLLGQQITRLTDRVLPAGYHSVVWEPFTLTSGMYILKIDAKSLSSDKKFSKSIKMIYLK
ncbi:T9SS type A sorting domain-containing protein, partial [Bacteroidota bacterium]